jgi:hypothetical protein
VRDLLGIVSGSKIDFQRAADGRIVLVISGKKIRVVLPDCAEVRARE